MGATSMQAVDPSPSTIFTCSNLNIFSASTVAMVDGVTLCTGPFSYKYTNLYNVWVVWCPVYVGSTNRITLSYPLYPSVLGMSFPFSLLLTYGYSNTAGRMIGYRLENNTGGVAR